ncbi:MAG: YncE family protein [Thermoplasmata archaeon]|nr:YncE family protein [Thermoplasmata archaeon]
MPTLSPGPAHQVAPLPSAPSTIFEENGTAWLAYDHNDLSFWVAVGSSSLDVVPADDIWGPDTVVPVGDSPFGVAVDPSAHQVFVTNTDSNNVSIVSDATDAPIASVGVGVEPEGVAFDPSEGTMFVANAGSNNVTVISTSTDSVVANISVGQSPVGLAFDPATDLVFVADENSDTVTVIHGITDTVAANISVGSEPYGVALDNATDSIFVTNQGSQNVSEISAVREQVTDSVSVGYAGIAGPITLEGIAYDNGTGQMWVGAGRASLLILNASPAAVSAYLWDDPSGAAFDPDTGQMCVTNSDNQSFECFQASSPWVENPVPIPFAESGLPLGTNWEVTMNDLSVQNSTGSMIRFEVMNTEISFAISAVDGYYPEPATYDYSGGTPPASVPVIFNLGTATYPVNFLESGLGSGQPWSILVGGILGSSTGPTISFDEPNGSHEYSVDPIPGYSTLRQYGEVDVNGQAVSETLNFTLFTFQVVLQESGLPAGATWFTNFTTSPPEITPPSSGPITSVSARFDLPNGSYGFSASTSNRSFLFSNPGYFQVNGNSITVPIDFALRTYPVAVAETGLVPGTIWRFEVSNPLQPFYLNSSTPGSHLTLNVPNGTYLFNVSSQPGYLVAPSNGTLPVEGPGSTLDIQFFFLVRGAISVSETGLPSGIPWFVNLSSGPTGFPLESKGPITKASTNLTLPNGSFGLSIVAADMDYEPYFNASVTVQGDPVAVHVQFLLLTFPITLVESGLPAGTAWHLTMTDLSNGSVEHANSSGSSVILALGNGTYLIVVQPPTGFSSNYSSTLAVVAGHPSVLPDVAFFLSGPGGGSGVGSTLSPSSIPWYLWGSALFVAGIIVGALVLHLARRQGKPGKPSVAARPPAP